MLLKMTVVDVVEPLGAWSRAEDAEYLALRTFPYNVQNINSLLVTVSVSRRVAIGRPWLLIACGVRG